MTPEQRERIGYDWRVPDGLISKWLRHGTVSRHGVYRGLHKHGSFRLDLTLRKRVIAARRSGVQPPRRRSGLWLPRRRRFGRSPMLYWLGAKNWLVEAARALGLVRPVPFTWDD